MVGTFWRALLGSVALGATLSACGGGQKNLTILDAAAIFEADGEAFASIRQAYQGPFTEFSRVPARVPSEEKPEDKEFFRELTKKVSVKYIDFFPMGDTKKDEIDVILDRYATDAGWNVVSLVYTDIPLPAPEDNPNMVVLEACDDRALSWLEVDHEADDVVAVFCRITERWYAYQSLHR